MFLLVALPRLASADDEIVWWVEREISRDGVTTVTESGSPRVEGAAADGGDFTVTPERLEDGQGGKYGYDVEAWQASEAEPVYVRSVVRRLADPSIDLAAACAEQVAAGGAPCEDAGTTVPPSVSMDAEVETWLEGDSDSPADVVVQLAGGPTLDLPSPAEWLMETDPAAAIDAMEERTLAIALYETTIDNAQRVLIEEVLGRRPEERIAWSPTANTFTMSLSPDEVRRLLDPALVSRIEPVYEIGNDLNDGIAVRAATQVQPYIDAGYEGESPSGLSGWSEIHGVVIDSRIDWDHPAYRDDALGTSRLKHVYRFTAGTWVDVMALGLPSSTNPLEHGMAVAATFAGDLTDGQHFGVVDPTVRAERSGNCYECSFDFIETIGSEAQDHMAKALTLEPDLVNKSQSDATRPCDLDVSPNDSADSLYLADIFVALSGTNASHPPGVCNFGPPGTAAGAFTVSCYNHVGVPDLNAAAICLTAGRGGDVHGRAVVDLVATGRETSNLPIFDDAYNTVGPTWGGSSAATPTVAGAAALLKEFLVVNVDAAFFNDVGNLYSTMLLMGDGTVETPPATVGGAPDEIWGVGRMRMRKFDPPGMDAPWLARWCTRLLNEGDTASCPAFPDSSGVNQPVYADVDRLRMVTWWFEPNLRTTEDPPANIGVRLRNETTGSVDWTYGGPQVKRARRDTSVGGNAWTVDLFAFSVSTSSRSGYYFGEKKRLAHVALYWEDGDRDDQDGPGPEIQ